MAVLFDPKNGTDRIATGAVIDVPTDWSAYWWMRRPSTVSGEPWSLGSGSPAYIEVYYSASTTDRLTVYRRTSGTAGNWTVIGADDGFAYSASQWVFVAVTQTGISTPTVYTAAPVQSVALATRTVGVGTTPTGSASTTTGQIMYLGNWSGFDYALGGDLAFFGFHNVVLTAAEIEEAMWRGMTPRGCVLATPLESTSKLYDLSGNALTLTNTGASDSGDTNPPVLPLWVPTIDQGWVPVRQPQALGGTITGAGSLTGNLSNRSTFSDYVLSKNPVVYHRMDEASGDPRDMSPNLNHAQYTGAGVTYGEDGGLAGDVNDAISYGANPSGRTTILTANPATYYTVAVLVKATGTATNWSNIVAHGWTSTGSFNLYESSSALIFGVVNGSGTQRNASSGAVIPRDGQWHRIVGVYDGTDVKLYLDGALVATQTIVTPPTLYSGTSWYFGDNAGAVSMVLDELALFDAAWTLAEVETDWDLINTQQLAGTIGGTGTLTGSLDLLPVSLAGTIPGTGALTGNAILQDPPPLPIITYLIEVQWDNTGYPDGGNFTIGTSTLGGTVDALWNPLLANWSGTHDDVTALARSFQIDRGRGSRSDVAFSGRAELELNDPTGIFNPANASSPIDGVAAPMRVLRITAYYANSSWVLFRGLIRRIAYQPSPNANAAATVRITAEDPLLYLERTEAVASSLDDSTIDAVAEHILKESRVARYLIPEPTNPTGGTGGTITFPGIAPGGDVSALSELRSLAEVEQGQLYADRDGFVVFASRAIRTAGTPTPVGTISQVAAGVVPSASLDAIVTRAIVTPGAGQLEGETAQIAENAAAKEQFGVSTYQLSSNYITSQAQAANIAAFVVARDGSVTDEIQELELRARSEAAIRTMLAIDLNDPIRVVDTLAGIDATYWVEGVKHQSTSGRGGHITRVNLTKHKAGLPVYVG